MDNILSLIKSVSEQKTYNNSATPIQILASDCALQNIQLRPYQVEGIEWLLNCFHNGHGCILGDEMGLGKTCQTIALLSYICKHNNELNSPSLILCPLSVMDNWNSEITLFATHLNVIKYVGSQDDRVVLKTEIKKQKGNVLTVVLTSYEICLRDEAVLGQFSWNILVVDEAQRLKNKESQLHQSLKEFETTFRLLLTGTPIQNNLKELYSLISFVAPKIFRKRYEEDFIRQFQGANDMSDLHQLLRPFLLRRVKSEVIKDLPVKTEVILYHGLSDLQKKYYKAILTKDKSIFTSTDAVKRNSLLNVLMQLRKCVSHPYLFNGIEPEPFELGEHLIDSSNKLLLLDHLLTFLHSNSHKVLLFSQMTHMLDIVQDYLGYRGYSYERLDGSLRGEERYLAINNFNKNKETFVFLLSTKAGGTGLNLTASDTVIFLDNDFNPQNDLQAAARAHRIGQTKPVKIIRLIGRNTVEEVIYQRAQAKLKLTHSVIDQGQFTGRGDQLVANNLQLQDILKFGLDNLLNKNDIDAEVDFKKLLGGTKDGCWLTEDIQLATSSPADESSASQSIYMFEGMDYSQQATTADVETLQQLLQESTLGEEASSSTAAEGRVRRKTVLPLLTGLPDKPKKQLTQEEKEKRRIQQQQVKEKRLHKAAEELSKLWEANNYVSAHLQDKWEEDVESETSDVDHTDEESTSGVSAACLNFVVGDVMKPQECHHNDVIILHCVDDSGDWGAGGLFTAISRLSNKPKDQYEKAKKLKDLHLGDAHLLNLSHHPKHKPKLWLCLLVVQHRDKHGTLSGIKLQLLEETLSKVSVAAKQMKASVHLPRIGHNTHGFNWYGTERLLKKHLCGRGISTYVYYFSRKRSQSPTSSAIAGPMPKKFRPYSPCSSTSSIKPLPTFFHGITVAFSDNVDIKDMKRCKRYIIAYDGDVTEDMCKATHFVLRDAIEFQTFSNQLVCNNSTTQPKGVTVAWINKCILLQKLIDTTALEQT